MRRFPLLLLAALLLFAAACSPSGPAPLRWTGEELSGAQFYERRLSSISVHYALPTSPKKAEDVARYADTVRAWHERWGRGEEGRALEVWVVPADRAWPEGVRPLPPDRPAVAVGPYQVILQEKENLATSSLDEAIAVALTQQEGSPLFAVDWLHDGMGSAMVSGWTLFPQERLKTPAADLFQWAQDPAHPSYRQGAAALAELLMDRWGLAWPLHYRRTPEELTPKAALRWATGLEAEAEAVALWQERVWFLTAGRDRPRYRVQSVDIPATAADISPLRMRPELLQLPVGEGPNENHSLHSFTIDARYDPAKRLVTGTEQITWQNGEGIPVDRLYFNLWANSEQFAIFSSYMLVDSVQVDGKEARFVAQSLDLEVDLGRSVQPGETAVVTIAFRTRIPNVISARDFGQERSRFNLAHWFPTLAVLDDRGWNLNTLRFRNAEPYSENTYFRVRLDLPAGWVIGATGHQVSRVEQGDRWIYAYDAPNVKDFVVTGGFGLPVRTVEIDGIAVHILHDDPAWVDRAVAELSRGIPFYNERFGRYPYPDLVVGCCVGMEWPGLIFGDPATREDRFLYVLHHELAHEWFYGIVGNDQYAEPWLDEGFTTFADRSLFRALGLTPNPEHIEQYQLEPGMRVTSSHDDYAVTCCFSAAYYMGARVLEDLQREIGPETMDRLMKEYVRRFQFRIATTADFIRVAEEVSGRDLREFFDQRKVFPWNRGLHQPVLPLGRAIPEMPGGIARMAMP